LLSDITGSAFACTTCFFSSFFVVVFFFAQAPEGSDKLGLTRVVLFVGGFAFRILCFLYSLALSLDRLSRSCNIMMMVVMMMTMWIAK
jgi:hypothetical protein